jgi:hypothetical protein
LRHRLVDPPNVAPTSPPVGAVERLVDDLVVLHATDPASVYLTVAARIDGVTVDDVDAALFDRRSLLRTLAMRRTLFVPTVATADAVEASSSVDVAVTERKRLTKFLDDTGIANPDRWLAARFDEVAAVLADTPDGLAARQLSAALPDLGTRILMGAGTKHPVDAPATSRVLGLMAVEGHLVRGAPTGDWTSRMYRWHRRDRWWPDGDGPQPETLSELEAASRLLRQWLGRFGPATVGDMKWWTGWTMTKTRKALAELDTVEVALAGESDGRLDGEPAGEVGHLLADDADPVAEPEPWAALLPSLDPTAMGWTHRHWYLGPHRDQLFDRNGNVGPTVWVDGRIVGGWSQRPDGQVVTELLEDVGSDHRTLIEAEVVRIQTFVVDVVVKPSFPTPLQKRLAVA